MQQHSSGEVEDPAIVTYSFFWNLSVKVVQKSVYICRSYDQNVKCIVFFETQCSVHFECTV